MAIRNRVPPLDLAIRIGDKRHPFASGVFGSPRYYNAAMLGEMLVDRKIKLKPEVREQLADPRSKLHGMVNIQLYMAKEPADWQRLLERLIASAFTVEAYLHLR